MNQFDSPNKAAANCTAAEFICLLLMTHGNSIWKMKFQMKAFNLIKNKKWLFDFWMRLWCSPLYYATDGANCNSVSLHFQLTCPWPHKLPVLPLWETVVWNHVWKFFKNKLNRNETNLVRLNKWNLNQATKLQSVDLNIKWSQSIYHTDIDICCYSVCYSTLHHKQTLRPFS